MITSKRVVLPRGNAFYTKTRSFKISVDGKACGTFNIARPKKGGPKTFSLPSPTMLLAPLNQAAASPFQASLETISEAAMRFYQPRGAKRLALVHYQAALFMERYFWGLAFTDGTVGSLEWNSSPRAPLHSEARKPIAESFAYGLALSFVANLLRVSTDRFFFVTVSGARADFESDFSAAELLAAGATFGALAPNGVVVEVEVKARSGWASFQSGSDRGRALLENLYRKSTSAQNRILLSTIVSVPSRNARTPTRKARTPTHLIVADPGEAQPLPEAEQAIILLEQLVFLLLRHGLWPTLRSALEWLQTLKGGHLSRREASLLRWRPVVDSPPLQGRICHEEHGGRTFIGWEFSEVVLRLGHRGRRHMPRREAIDRLETSDFGHFWFSGVDMNLIAIVQEKRLEELLRHGTGSPEAASPPASAFYFMPFQPDPERQNLVRRSLEQALQKW